MKVQGILKWGVSIGIGAFFIWLAFREWPVDRLLEGGVTLRQGVLATSSWRVPLASLGLYFASLVVMHVFRVWRWQPLLAPMQRIGFGTLNRVCSVGFMAVFLLPMRLGELVRPALLSTESDIRRSAALATIVVERLVDGVMVAGFLATALVFLPRHNAQSFSEIRWGTYLALAVFLGSALVLGVLILFRKRVAEGVRWLVHHLSPRWGARLQGATERFLEGLGLLPSAGNIGAFFLLSFLYWLSNGVGLFLLGQAFEVRTDLGGWTGLGVPMLGAFAMMSTIVIGMMIPNAPANVGSFWYFLLKPMELYGVPAGHPGGLAFALLVWTFQLLQLLVFGGWFVLKGAVSFRRAFDIRGGATAILLVACLWPSPGRADTVWQCRDRQGNVGFYINTRPSSARCRVYLDSRKASEPSHPKGARCRSMRFRTTIFFVCEKDGVSWIYNRSVPGEASERGGGAQEAAESGTPRPERAKGQEPFDQEIRRLVTRAAAETGIPEAMLLAVIEVESGFRADVVSPAGAQGLMQLMPVTADALEVVDPFDPEQNILGGARLLRRLSDRFQGDLEKTLAAYYAGASAVIRAGGPPDEPTRGYVRKVLDRYRRHAEAKEPPGPGPEGRAASPY